MSKLRFISPILVLIFGFFGFRTYTSNEVVLGSFFIYFVTFWVTLIGFGLYSGKHSLSSSADKKKLNILSLIKSLLFIQIAVVATSDSLGVNPALNTFFLVDVCAVSAVTFFIDKWIYDKYKVDNDIPEEYTPSPYLQEWSRFFMGKNLLIHAIVVFLLGIFFNIKYIPTLFLIAVAEIIFFYFKHKNLNKNNENKK